MCRWWSRTPTPRMSTSGSERGAARALAQAKGHHRPANIQFVEQVRSAQPVSACSLSRAGRGAAATARAAPTTCTACCCPCIGDVPGQLVVLRGSADRRHPARDTVQADAGGIVDTETVPIPAITRRSRCSARSRGRRTHLARAWPHCWPARRLRSQDLKQGAYFGRRTPADGAIDWQLGVAAVHNLVRAVAPPYPGAYALAADLPLRVLRTLTGDAPRAARAELRLIDGEVQAVCPDGALRLLEFELDGQVRDAQAFGTRFGARALPLENGQRNLQEAAGK